jgi:O-antigen biosynthesis protein
MTPMVSVILPAYHSERTLAPCLHALRRQHFRDFEMIVVNSSQESSTAAIIRDFPEVRFWQSPERLLPHAARNRGVEMAKGELLVFTDPDCEADPFWLENLVCAWKGGRKVLVGGMECFRSGWRETGIHLCKYHWLLSGLPAGCRRIAPTANAAYSREIWDACGPFRGEVFAGDGVMSWRAAAMGHPPWFVPGAVVRHHHENGWRDFCRERWQRGAEYARVRLSYSGKSHWRTWLLLFLSVTFLPWVLVRAGRDAGRAGYTKFFLATLPLQLVGHGFWALGESWQTVVLAGSWFPRRRIAT